MEGALPLSFTRPPFRRVAVPCPCRAGRLAWHTVSKTSSCRCVGTVWTWIAKTWTAVHSSSGGEAALWLGAVGKRFVPGPIRSVAEGACAFVRATARRVRYRLLETASAGHEPHRTGQGGQRRWRVGQRFSGPGRRATGPGGRGVAGPTSSIPCPGTFANPPARKMEPWRARGPIVSYVVRRTLFRYGAGNVELDRAGRLVGDRQVADSGATDAATGRQNA